jgi:hypothetical protein
VGGLALAGADSSLAALVGANVFLFRACTLLHETNRRVMVGRKSPDSIRPRCGAIRCRRITPPEGLRSCGSGPSKPGRLGGEPLRVPVAEPIALFATGGNHARVIVKNF